MRRARWAAPALVALLAAACSGSSPEVPEGRPPEAGRSCAPLPVTPGAGPIAWTVTAPGEHGSIETDPVAVGDGFLVGVGGCIGFLEASGRSRWTISGLLVDGARVDDTVVIAVSGRPSIVGVDAASGAVRWSREDRALWQDVAVQGRTVMVVGSSFDGAVVTLDPSTGRGIAAGLHPSTDDGFFHLAVADEGVLLTAGPGGRSGIPGRRGPVVAADASGRIVLDVSSGLFAPDPVGVAGDVIVVQASGSTTGEGDGERSTHLLGLDLRTGAERWRRVLPGPGAGDAVEVGGVVVVRHEQALAGLDAGSGEVRWSVPVPESYESPLVGAGPDAVAVGAREGTVMVVEVEAGTLRWSVRTEGQVAVLGALDGVLLVASDPDFYHAYRLADGAPLWTARGVPAGAGSSRGGKRARMVVAGDTGATLSGLQHVVALRRHP